VALAVKVATLAAAGKAARGLISAQVAVLTEGVLKTMFLTKLKVATTVLLTVAAIAFGVGVLAQSAPGRKGDRPLQNEGQPALSLVAGPGALARDDDNDANAILDKAIRAIGGEARLKKAKAIAWKAKGKSLQDGNEHPFTNETIVQGLDLLRMEWEDDINGNRVPGLTVLNGSKGWRKTGDNATKLDITVLEGDRLANQKRNLYLLVIPITLVPLKEKGFQIRPAGEVKVGDNPSVGLHVTGPDGKNFNLFFDKKSRLAVKLEVRMGSQGKEFTQETIFGDYKDFDGIKRATRLERRRDGAKILEQEITEFRVLENVDPATFAEPK
jgi:hypothetical protein